MELIRYDAMCSAIAEAHAVDEVKDIRDKALALENYAKQARNMDAENQAKAIRLRAERKAGELLKETSKRGRPEKRSSRPTISEQGISKYQSANWQALADVPIDDFERELAQPETASTTGIIQRHIKPKERKSNGATGKMHPFALWLWGRLVDFEETVDDTTPEQMLGEMTETMRRDVLRVAPLVIDYLSRFEVPDDDT